MKEYSVSPVQIVECRGIHNGEGSNNDFFLSVDEHHIELNHNQNSFRISFAVPDYAQSKQVEYAYMLDGLDDMWSNTLGENQVIFRSLPSGNYTFKVKARLKNQEWNDSQIATLIVIIHPPIFLTWYALLFYLLILLLITYVFIRSYQRKLKRKSSIEIERQNSLNEQNLNKERLNFYTNITHELRTPLTLIIGPLEDLSNEKNLPELYSKKINSIHLSAMRLLNLINQLLEFRKTETHHRQLTVCKNNIANLITEIGLRYKELNRNPKVKIHVQIETENSIIYYDTDIINIILNNLLSNAVKYTPEGDITLTLKSVIKSEKEYTVISVSDTGYGIEENELPHIFDRYYQSKSKHQASGTGIGLALVKSLAILHNGLLEVDSSVGIGTTFTFSILTNNNYPDAIHKEGKNDVAAISFDDAEEVSTLQHVMLIVEDNDEIREYISSSFRSEYKIIEAATGKEGVELALSTIPNIIISDIMMPEMNGIELCRTIKEDMRTSHIPIILLTAKDSIRDKEEGYESGADSYLTKPFSAKLLHSRIRNLLESRAKIAKYITDNKQGIDGSLTSINFPKLSNLDRAFLEKLTKIIEDNLDVEKFDIDFLTNEIGMSHSTLYRKIKGLTGMTANEFIRKIRIRNSLRLMQSGDYNVSEAAYMTGFNNLGYFRECFKEEYGTSPSEYMKKQKL
jgi:Signal transduction histidine kinase